MRATDGRGALCAAVIKPGMNCKVVVAIPPAMKSDVPVTAALRANMAVLSRGVVDMAVVINVRELFKEMLDNARMNVLNSVDKV